jgi:hypothetical protein
MMGTANYIGRIGALAVALGIGRFRPTATRMTVSVGVAAVVVAATVVPAPVSTVSPAVKLSADSTALIMCGTTCPTPDEYVVESAMNQFIMPTHPGQAITPIAVTTPEEAWPIAGLLRLVGAVTGDPRLFGLDGPAWPDEPWWKLSGLFDLLIDQSVQAGVADLEAAMAAHGNDHLVIFGYSQSAHVAITEKRKLAEQYPPGTTAPDIDFVLLGDPNLPNGGIAARFPGLPTVILGTFDGPEPTNTQFHTDVITRQYDGFADFPLYPLNVIADLNAVMGILYLHTNGFGVSLPADPTTSPAYQGTHGDSSYYLFETKDLPLFAPLRQLGVPESLIDVVEPFFRVLVELGYDRSIPPWEPTPARLIPTLDPVKVINDLVNAIGEGANNAAALVGLPPMSSSPAPVTLAASATQTAKTDMSPQVMSKDAPTQTEQATSTGAAIDTRQVSTDTAPLTAVTETAQADVSPQDGPTEPVTETDQPTSAQTSSDTEQPTSPNAARASTLKPEKHRPLVRDSLRVGQQPSERSERGEGDQPTTRTVAAGAEASTGEPSSTGSSSAGPSSAGSSSDSGSSDGDGS